MQATSRERKGPPEPHEDPSWKEAHTARLAETNPWGKVTRRLSVTGNTDDPLTVTVRREGLEDPSTVRVEPEFDPKGDSVAPQPTNLKGLMVGRGPAT